MQFESWRSFRLVVLALLLAVAGGAQASIHAATQASLRGLAVVGHGVIWASGTGGTVLRSVDGGRTWRVQVVPGAAGLDFRDVEALDAQHAWLMSAGAGRLSRVYSTSDGGRHWRLLLTEGHAAGFFDAMAFFDGRHGLVLGDPVDGRFEVLRTSDGGAHWRRVAAAGMPRALPKEGAFAASGTCLMILGQREAWFATGGGREARVFRSSDGGRSWRVAGAPLQAGSPGAGIFSLAFWNARDGVAVGGDYLHPGVARGNIAFSRDGGKTWRATVRRPPAGYRSAVAFQPGSGGRVLAATGPNGTDISTDGGRTWRTVGRTGYNCVAFTPGGEAWLAGPEGRLARLRITAAGR